MAKYTVGLSKITGKDLLLVGAKAAGLAELRKAGFAVPQGFCVTTAAFRRVKEALAASGVGPSGAGQAIASLALPRAMVREVVDRYQKTFPGRPVAVRSSGVLEDLPEASFAGQYDTFLNVTGPRSLEEKLRRCWASAWNERVLSYCAKRGIPYERLQMAVVVQEMIPAEVSGVLFTVNPLTGVDTEMLLEAAWGLGEGLVSGRVEPDQFVLDVRTGQVLRSRVGEKLNRVKGVRGGTREVKVSGRDRGRLCLTGEQLRELAAAGRKVQIHYGAPQDIEFAYAGRQLHLLQARPITTLSFAKDLGEWTTADFRDGGVSAAVCSPFMWSLYDSIWRHTMPDYMKGLGLLQGEIDRDEWGRLFFGRPYWNVGAVKRCLFNIPGFVERNFDKDLSIIVTYEGDGVTTPVTPLRVVKAIPAILALKKTYREQIAFDRKYVVEFEEIEKRIDELPIGRMPLQELVPHYRDLIENVYFRMESNYFLTIFNQSNSKLDFKVCLDKLNARGNSVAYLNLISGIPHLRTLLPLQDLWKLADRIVKEPGLRDALLAMDTRRMTRKVAAAGAAGAGVDGRATPAGRPGKASTRGSAGAAAVWSEIRAYIEKYRYHSRSELDITVPRWDEDLEFVLETLKDFLRAHDRTPDPELQHRKQYELYLTERKKGEDAFRKGGLARIDFYSRKTFFDNLELVRNYAWWREEMRDRSTRTYYLIRKYTVEIARRLVKNRTIREADDLFFLRFAQVFDLLEGRMSPAEARGIIAENRVYNASFRNFRNPNEIGWRWKVEEDLSAAATACESLSGIGCSPGVRRGRVKVIRDIAESHRLEKDDVLVTFFTDPGWTPVLNLVSAVVTETGGLLSHAAIISREYGIPAVLNVKRATSLLRDGQTIEVDGDQGVVRVL